jgi:hypothetical protein
MPVSKDVRVTTIPDSTIDRILNRLPETMNQGRRLVALLGRRSRLATREVNQTCSIGNISDIAAEVNPYLHLEGFFIGCDYPDEPIINKFGEKSNQFLWSTYDVTPAANDAEGGEL